MHRAFKVKTELFKLAVFYILDLLIIAEANAFLIHIIKTKNTHTHKFDSCNYKITRVMHVKRESNKS